MTTWRHELAAAMMSADDPGPILALAEDAAQSFDVEFDSGFGSTNGPPVLAWTEHRVYFPACYDGLEWMASAPRNPQAEGQFHVGD
jgi:hypothetical protein